jgi:hypothetical protein
MRSEKTSSSSSKAKSATSASKVGPVQRSGQAPDTRQLLSAVLPARSSWRMTASLSAGLTRQRLAAPGVERPVAVDGAPQQQPARQRPRLPAGHRVAARLAHGLQGLGVGRELETRNATERQGLPVDGQIEAEGGRRLAGRGGRTRHRLRLRLRQRAGWRDRPSIRHVVLLWRCLRLARRRPKQ